MAELPAPHQPTLDAIYRAYEAKADRTQRGYLGMSTMGNECDRAIWYAFRWAHPPEQLDGRKLRLFQTGHREEARMLDDLEALAKLGNEPRFGNSDGNTLAQRCLHDIIAAWKGGQA